MSIVRTAIIGMIVGPPFGFLYAFLNGAWSRIRISPADWLWSTMAIGMVFSVLFYVCCGIPFIYLRRFLPRFGRVGAWVAALTVCVVGGMSAGLLAPTIIQVVAGIKLIPDGAWHRVLVVNTLIAVGIGVIFGNYRRFEMLKEIRERELAAATAKAETSALQAQISPHFFFNALNSVSALVPGSPEAAQEMLARLGGIFRYTFSCGRQEMVPLARELDFVREYLQLEKVRYRERLRFALPENYDLPDVLVPGLSLQPIVENAIRYGIARRISGGVVRIEIQHQEGCCRILVSNQFDPQDGPPDLSDSQLFKPDHALHNVRERLRLLFGEEAGIAFAQNGPDWVLATVTVPRRQGGATRCV